MVRVVVRVRFASGGREGFQVGRQAVACLEAIVDPATQDWVLWLGQGNFLPVGGERI